MSTLRKNICSDCWERRNIRLIWNILFWWVWIEEERHKLFCFVFNLVIYDRKTAASLWFQVEIPAKKIISWKKLKKKKAWLLGVQYFWKVSRPQEQHLFFWVLKIQWKIETVKFKGFELKNYFCCFTFCFSLWPQWPAFSIPPTHLILSSLIFTSLISLVPDLSYVYNLF